MYLLIHEVGHVLFYLVVVFSVYLFFRNTGKVLLKPKYLLIGLLSTIFIDLDHFIDHFIYYGFSFNFLNFTSGTHFELSGKVFVFLHSWELLCLLLFIGYYLIRKKNSYIIFVIAVGMMTHVLYDTAYYGFSLEAYSLIYRLIMGFDIFVFRRY